MSSYPRFRISGSPTCPAAQRAGLALSLRGRHFDLTNGAGKTRLLIEQGPGLVLAIKSSVAMLELIEDLHPDQPLHPAEPALRARHRQLISAADAAQDTMLAVTTARNLRDLDIAVFVLRQRLLAIETELLALSVDGMPPGSNLDIALAPLLWRVAVLDRRHRLHLGDGLPGATQRLARLLARPEVRRVLSLAAGQAFLDELAAQGAVVALTTDIENWNRCFDSSPAGEVLPLRPHSRPIHTRISGTPLRLSASRHDW
jgi:glutathione S-transferase